MNRSKYFTQVLDSFQKNRGKASLYCFDDAVIFELVYKAIDKILNKTPSANIFIVLNDYRMRMRLASNLREKGIDIDNVKLLTEQFINGRYHYAYHFTIIIGVSDYLVIKHLTDESKFTLCILTKNIMNNEFINSVRNILPNILVSDISNIISADRLTSPVEEYRYGVDMSEQEYEQYSKYDDYISNCISIFNNLDNIEKCKVGVPDLGISAAEFRETFAKENGWSETLDTNIEYVKQIDDTYNPNNLYEKAYNFFNIAKKRRDFVSDSESKFQTVLDIVLDNLDKQILIVSKRGEYAAKLTNYINNSQTQVRCGDYHDCIEDAVATDMTGNVMLYKSGVNKGKPKVLKSQAQSTLNERAFNSHVINVLSIKEASDTTLKIACNCVIFTSALCYSIKDLKLRFTNIDFGTDTLQTYRVYCNNTIEQVKLNKDKPLPFVSYIDETENNFEYDENINGIVL